MAKLRQWLEMEPSERTKFHQEGIPCDTTLNELPQWIVQGRFSHKELKNVELRVVLKADKNTKYPAISNVIETFRALRVHNFALITRLEADPRKTIN